MNNFGTEVWDSGVWFLYPIACAALAATFWGIFLPFPNQKSRLNYFEAEVWDFGVWFLYPVACAALAATFLGKFLPFPNPKSRLNYFGTEVLEFEKFWSMLLWNRSLVFWSLVSISIAMATIFLGNFCPFPN